MDSWTTFPDPLEQLPTHQQLQTSPLGYTLLHEFDRGHESALHDCTSAQQTSHLQPLQPLSLSQEHLVPVPQGRRIPSVTNAELTATAMGPPPKRRKKKAPTLRAKDWEPYKARILELHDARKQPLVKVKEMIEEEFGFTAELRQYRTRITQWGKDKNIKPAEMAAIVRKRQKRKLVEVDKGEQIFSVRGRNVETHKIDRWMVRHEVSQASLYAPSPVASTPSAILCRTISEHGSVTPSPAYSTRSLNFSSRSTRSTTASPMTSFPVTLMPGLGYSQNGDFDIQSHDHAYQPAPTTPSVRQSQLSDIFPPDILPHHYTQAEEMIKGALPIAESSLGAYHSQTLDLSVKLGEILHIKGRYKHAEEIARKAVEDCENNESALIIKFRALQLLRDIIHEQGSCHQSRRLQEWLFEWGKVNLGKEHRSVVRGMIELSGDYVNNGNIKEGEELCVQALKISKEAFGESDIDTIRAMNGLVHTYTKQGRLNEAERLGLQLLENSMALPRNRHLCTITCMFRLATVYYRQGRLNEAEKLQGQVLEMSMHSLGEENQLTYAVRHNLSLVYKSQGRLEEAQELQEQVLRVVQRVWGEQHHKTLDAMCLMIEIYDERGRIARAEELRVQKQELERRVLERQKEDVGLDFSFMAG